MKMQIMRKIINFCVPAAFILAALLSQGCSAYRMAGFTADGIVYREWYGNIGVSYALDPSFDRSFNDAYSGKASPFYYEIHNGQYTLAADISATGLISIFSNDSTRVSCGIKAADNCSYQYSYSNSFANIYTGKVYTYSNTSVINFFSRNTFSFVFPNIEYRLPFAKFLTADFTMELAAFTLYYRGGSNTHTYSSNTQSGVLTDTNVFAMPNSIAAAVLNSQVNIFGSMTLGLLYNF
jgi:hypothetical protein